MSILHIELFGNRVNEGLVAKTDLGAGASSGAGRNIPHGGFQCR